MVRSRIGALVALCAAICAFSSIAVTDASFSSDSPKEIHGFFYLWYGNPETDGKFLHWDHEILEHWTPSIAAQYAKGKFQPPGDIGATYMPQRRFYSSNNPRTLDEQCRELRAAGVDVIAASWWPSGRGDGQGVDTDRCIPNLLNAAKKHGLKVNFHLEPYKDRSAESVREDIKYIIDTYGKHQAFYRHKTKHLPMFYVYDTYLSSAQEWAQLFSPHSHTTLRRTQYDSLFIALVLKLTDQQFLQDSYADGFYTYFASDGFSFGSTTSNWPQLASWAGEDKLFIPSIGPGYDDTRIRPWNGQNKRDRDNGAYYRHMFNKAMVVDPAIITITSLNEWGEGTQIEPAVPYTTEKGEKLQDYGSDGPSKYMDMTRDFARQFKQIGGEQPHQHQHHQHGEL